MKRKLLNGSVVWLLALSFLACSSDRNEMEPNEGVTKTYKLASVQWKIGEDDGLEVIEQAYPVAVYSNPGDDEMPIEIDILKDVEETSHFIFTEVSKEVEQALNLATWVSVPTEIFLLSDRYSYLTGGSQAPVVLNTKSTIESSRSMTSTTQLAKRTKMTIDKTVFFNKIQATCLLRFVEEGDGFDSFEVEGKWIGVLFANIERRVVFTDLN